MQELNIKENEITEIKGLENLINLQRLYFSRNKITEIKNLDNLINLQELYLNDNQITEIKGLNNLFNLKAIYLNNNQIIKSQILDNLKNLILVSLYRNPIFDRIKEQFNVTLSPHKAVEYCGKMNNEYIKEFIKNLPSTHKEISIDKIISKTRMKLKYLKPLIEDMIINKEINAQIRDEYLTFEKRDYPMELICTNCNYPIQLKDNMKMKDVILCENCGKEIEF